MDKVKRGMKQKEREESEKSKCEKSGVMALNNIHVTGWVVILDRNLKFNKVFYQGEFWFETVPGYDASV